MRVDKGDKYECAVCHGKFDAEVSHDDAVAEAEENFGEEIMEAEIMDVVCDDCLQENKDVIEEQKCHL